MPLVFEVSLASAVELCYFLRDEKAEASSEPLLTIDPMLCFSKDVSWALEPLGKW